jgi:hypothetical protein
MLPGVSASEFTTLDRILKRLEEELIEEALAELPEFILERQPRVMFENKRHGSRPLSDVRRSAASRVARAELGVLLRPHGAVRRRSLQVAWGHAIRGVNQPAG